MGKLMLPDRQAAQITRAMSARLETEREVSARAKRLQARRVGIMGGSFDPPHKAHVAICVAAAAAAKLDMVVLLPAGLNPLKQGQAPPASNTHRVNMVALAAEDVVEHARRTLERPLDVVLCTAEVLRPPPSFAIDTVERLAAGARAEAADVEWFWIAGSDVLGSLHKWRRIRDLLRLARLIVVARHADFSARAAAGMLDAAFFADPAEREAVCSVAVVVPVMEVASSALRQQLRVGDAAALGELPAGVARYVQDHGLYRAML
jgi:nicotinate-nucleotide adenylyltransferase